MISAPARLSSPGGAPARSSPGVPPGVLASPPQPPLSGDVHQHVQVPERLPMAVSEPRLLYIAPRLLVPDADNVRREPGDLNGLAASLRQYGVLQPLGVVPHEDGLSAPGQRYRVIYGNRRRAAAIIAGLSAV